MGNGMNARIRLDLQPDVLHLINKMSRTFFRQLGSGSVKEVGKDHQQNYGMKITIKRTLGLWLFLNISSEN